MDQTRSSCCVTGSGNAAPALIIIVVLIIPLNKQPPTLAGVAGHFWNTFSLLSPNAQPSLSLPHCFPPPPPLPPVRPRIRGARRGGSNKKTARGPLSFRPPSSVSTCISVVLSNPSLVQPPPPPPHTSQPLSFSLQTFNLELPSFEHCVLCCWALREQKTPRPCQLLWPPSLACGGAGLDAGLGSERAL